MQQTEKKSPFAPYEIKVSYKKIPNPQVITTTAAAYKFLKKIWDKELINIQEQFYVIFLDNASQVLGWRLICTGTANKSLVDIRFIMALAIKTLSRKVIIAHNHPSGKTVPSDADINLTLTLKMVFKSLDIVLLDHLIITAKDYYSFKDYNLVL